MKLQALSITVNVKRFHDYSDGWMQSATNPWSSAVRHMTDSLIAPMDGWSTRLSTSFLPVRHDVIPKIRVATLPPVYHRLQRHDSTYIYCHVSMVDQFGSI